MIGRSTYIGGGLGIGFIPSYRIDVYSPASNLWSPCPINTPHHNFAMTTFSNQLITAGGMDRSDEVTNKIFLIKDNQLKEYTRMNVSRHEATAASHQGALIIAGGKDYLNRVLLLLLLLFGFTVSSTEGLTATCAAAFELS